MQKKLAGKTVYPFGSIDINYDTPQIFCFPFRRFSDSPFIGAGNIFSECTAHGALLKKFLGFQGHRRLLVRAFKIEIAT
jgi:hypothetical protein